ncbi:tRNA (adenine(58)-N(1))-methyltransferase catalytic subunit TRM61 [Trichomonascus vanleenenianus]|uniref:tRNA 1-methyladenosine methyltransferase subunit GCD14 n=1 Tax=Trichomonascus vanleenenianus TaxID=2268995 RepID=UPI003ECBAEFA
MSFTGYSSTIQENDLVLAWMTRTNVKPIVIKKGEVLNTRFGAFPHEAMIGAKFGSQVSSSSGKGFIHLLAPSPELWTVSLPHRTQIVYTPDSSYIVQRLNIRPGTHVIESGTGSGSFTHQIARTVSKRGKVYTYEFHEPRFHQAKAEIDEHGLADIVTITHRDVCNNGFDIEQQKLEASAVFLDLPSPWAAIPHLKSVVTRERIVSICCFSPCIEQVTKTIEVLKKEGFQRIETVEVSAKKWEARKDMIRDISEAVERLRDVKNRRNEGIKKKHELLERKRAREESGEPEEEDEEEQKEEEQNDSNEPQGKRGYNPWGMGLRIKEGDPQFSWNNVSKVEPEIKSHTSYLTFAILPPNDSVAPSQ